VNVEDTLVFDIKYLKIFESLDIGTPINWTLDNFITFLSSLSK